MGGVGAEVEFPMVASQVQWFDIVIHTGTLNHMTERKLLEMIFPADEERREERKIEIR